MPFTFVWHDESKTALRYQAEGDWNWKDYHTCVRGSLFTLHGHDQQVDSIIDLRGSTRTTMPSGLPAHIRTFGKRSHPNLTGRAVVIGLPDYGFESLHMSSDQSIATSDGVIRFVESEDALHALLMEWQQNNL
ncbi:MAG: hypothetical protein RLP44_28060 [Aggregatilineales bacterium]